MIKEVSRGFYPDHPDAGEVNGFVLGQTGVRDAKIYCNSVSGEIQTDSPKVKAITNYNRWLAQ